MIAISNTPALYPASTVAHPALSGGAGAGGAGNARGVARKSSLPTPSADDSHRRSTTQKDASGNGGQTKRSPAEAESGSFQAVTQERRDGELGPVQPARVRSATRYESNAVSIYHANIRADDLESSVAGVDLYA